jgi:hypothetical protein
MADQFRFTEKQGQYLAFIHSYTLIHGEPPAESDMQRFFGVTPPSVHQMVLQLEKRGLISRVPGKARSIQVLVPPEELPRLHNSQTATPPNTPIYQLKVTLDYSSPPIWRRIQVPGNVTLEHLHHILQVAMGWTDSHLHQFIVGNTYYGVPFPDYGFTVKDESQVQLSQIARGEGFTFKYEYDFGDGWTHSLTVEKILEPEPGQEYPRCVKGRRAAPPEDVGGIPGYEYFLEAIQDPQHPEHEEYLEWIGGEFDPQGFDLQETNELLRELS